MVMVNSLLTFDWINDQSSFRNLTKEQTIIAKIKDGVSKNNICNTSVQVFFAETFFIFSGNRFLLLLSLQLNYSCIYP